MTSQATSQGRPDNWKEKIAKNWYLTKVADNALQIEKDGRRQAAIERLIKKTQDGSLGKPTDEPMDEELGEMAVNVGNETYVHNAAPPVAPAPPESKLAGAAKVLAATGLAAAGLGTAAALPIAAYGLMKPDAAPVTVEVPRQEDRDTNTKYNLRIYRDE